MRAAGVTVAEEHWAGDRRLPPERGCARRGREMGRTGTGGGDRRKLDQDQENPNEPAPDSIWGPGRKWGTVARQGRGPRNWHLERL